MDSYQKIAKNTFAYGLEVVREKIGEDVAKKVSKKLEIPPFDLEKFLFGMANTKETTDVFEMSISDGQVVIPQPIKIFQGLYKKTEREVKSTASNNQKRLKGELEKAKKEKREATRQQKKSSGELSKLQGILDKSGYSSTKRWSSIIPFIEGLPEKIKQVLIDCTDSEISFWRRFNARISIHIAIADTANLLRKAERKAKGDVEQANKHANIAQEKIEKSKLQEPKIWQKQCQATLLSLIEKKLANLNGWRQLNEIAELISSLEVLEKFFKDLRAINRYLRGLVDGSYQDKAKEIFVRLVDEYFSTNSDLKQLLDKMEKIKKERSTFKRKLGRAQTPDEAKEFASRIEVLDQNIYEIESSVEYNKDQMSMAPHRITKRIHDYTVAVMATSSLEMIARFVQSCQDISSHLFGCDTGLVVESTQTLGVCVEKIKQKLDKKIAQIIREEVNEATQALKEKPELDSEPYKRRDNSLGQFSAAFDFDLLYPFLQNNGKAIIFGVEYGASSYCTKGEKIYKGPGCWWFPRWLRGRFDPRTDSFPGIMPWQFLAYYDDGNLSAYVTNDPSRRRSLWLPYPKKGISKENLVKALDRFTKHSCQTFSRQIECDVYSGFIEAFYRIVKKGDRI